MNLVIGRRVGWRKSVEILLPGISSFGSNKLSIKILYTFENVYIDKVVDSAKLAS